MADYGKDMTKGAASGAITGAAIGGPAAPITAAIGAVLGAAGGAIGAAGKEKKAKKAKYQMVAEGRAQQARATEAAKKGVTANLDAPAPEKRGFRDILNEGRSRRMGASMGRAGIPDVSSMDERTRQMLLQQLRPTTTSLD